jgi:hypothetical protein
MFRNLRITTQNDAQSTRTQCFAINAYLTKTKHNQRAHNVMHDQRSDIADIASKYMKMQRIKNCEKNEAMYEKDEANKLESTSFKELMHGYLISIAMCSTIE